MIDYYERIDYYKRSMRSYVLTH